MKFMKQVDKSACQKFNAIRNNNIKTNIQPKQQKRLFWIHRVSVRYTIQIGTHNESGDISTEEIKSGQNKPEHMHVMASLIHTYGRMKM